MIGLFNARPIDFANEVPTKRDPNKPGPLVNAMASIRSSPIPDSFMALSTIGIIFFLWLLFLIFKLATITAFLGLSSALLFLFFSLIAYSKNSLKTVYVAGIACLFFLLALYTTTTVKDFYHIKTEQRSFQTHSLGGEKYQQDLKDNTTENGYYLWENIAQNELERAWNKRSKYSFQSKDKKQQAIKGTLYRFLTSKGLNKDSAGLSKLNVIEIKKIENGETSFVRYNNFETRIRSLLYEWELRKKNKGPKPPDGQPKSCFLEDRNRYFLQSSNIWSWTRRRQNTIQKIL